MSTRTSLRPQQVIVNASMAADVTSEPTILQSLTKCGYQINWSAGSTPLGDLYVQVSNDYELSPDGKNVVNAGSWKSIDLNSGGAIVSSIPISGNTGTGFIDVTTSAYAIRLFYDRTSGSATMNAFITGKVS